METKISAEIGERLALLRGSQTRIEFANEFGIHVNTLARYEKGGNFPDSELLKGLLEKRNVNPAWVLTGKGEMYLSDLSQSTVAEARQTYSGEPAGELTPRYRTLIALFEALNEDQQKEILDIAKEKKRLNELESIVLQLQKLVG